MLNEAIPETLRSGQVIGKCRVVRFLGRGGMGEVYLGEHLTLKKLVALKILPPLTLDPQRVARFLKEAQRASQIEHSNVVTVYDVDRHGNCHYILMQYVEGQNLMELVPPLGATPPWRTALKLIRHAAKGLGAVHAAGLIHRDIKPSNIMVSHDGRVLLMDFGLAQEEGGVDLTKSKAILGTPAFMSPEQARGERLDKRSDIFSLGSTLYYLLTARLPFDGPTNLVVGWIGSGIKPPLSVHNLNPNVPLAIAEAVSKAMAFKPQNRYHDAEAFAKELQRLGKMPFPEPVSLDTSSEVGSLVDTPNPESVTELVPLELISDVEVTSASSHPPWKQYLPWLIAGTAVLACVILLVVNGFFAKTDIASSTAVVPTQAAVAAMATQPLQGPKGNVDVSSMVRIPTGKVWMPVKDKELLMQTADFNDNPDRLNTLSPKSIDQEEEQVDVAEFYIDKYEVTQREYAKFLKATSRQPPEQWKGNNPPAGQEDHPVTNVRFSDAQAYAAWVGKQLPSVAQWLRAYRGDTRNLYPWGNQWDNANANVGENKGFARSSPVDATPRDISPMKVYNLAGNVREILGHEIFVKVQQADNTVMQTRIVVAKGGDFNSPGKEQGAATWRTIWQGTEDYCHPLIGFRCVYRP